ncbi:hypothetical protein G6O67_005545 [Ophiocordyceps sinensis]|uniref:Uncharacterized protein n=1 Tax=Ophiocordyceps sinensis TaxID=72228 RepID=A0A8H4PRX5_9HYPO|nr:hypothetical protein G6O67_005545 [Ophiocordyceps sinensis]
MLVVRALAAPHYAGSAPYNDQRTAGLKVERAVDAFSEAALLSNTLKARQGLSNHASEAASTTKTSISEPAVTTATSMEADNQKELSKKLGMDAGLNLRARSAERKREAAPQPWCGRRAWLCWKRHLSHVDAAASVEPMELVLGGQTEGRHRA